MQTTLPDSLFEYYGEINGGENKKTNIIIEVPNNISISSLSMTVTHGGGTLTKVLQ